MSACLGYVIDESWTVKLAIKADPKTNDTNLSRSGMYERLARFSGEAAGDFSSALEPMTANGVVG